MTKVPGDFTSSSPHLAAMESESFPPSMPTPQSSKACVNTEAYLKEKKNTIRK